MTTSTTELTEHDLDVLVALLEEFHRAGRMKEARAIARMYSAAQGLVYPDLADDLDNDPELARQFEEAEREYAEGRTIPHEEAVRRLRALDNGEG